MIAEQLRLFAQRATMITAYMPGMCHVHRRKGAWQRQDHTTGQDNSKK